MRSLEIHADAEAELREAAAWYDARRAEVGSRLLDEVARVVALLRSTTPPALLVARVRPDLRLRRVLLRRFPYSVVLFEREDVVHVIAVAHQKRKPAYWRARLPP